MHWDSAFTQRPDRGKGAPCAAASANKRASGSGRWRPSTQPAQRRWLRSAEVIDRRKQKYRTKRWAGSEALSVSRHTTERGCEQHLVDSPKEMSFFRTRGSWFLVALLSQACVADDAVEGVRHPVWIVDATPHVTIGLMEGEAPYLFQTVAGARLLADGRVVVADRGHAVLRVFDENGTYLSEMGGSGQGPGEFQYINALIAQHPDTLDVYDSRAFRLTRYLADGTLVGTLQVLGKGGFPEVFLGRFGNGDLAFAWISQEPRPLGSIHADAMQMGRFDATGRFVQLLGESTGMWRWEGAMYPFSPHFYGFTKGDSVFFTDGLRPELRIVDLTGGDSGSIPLHATPKWGTDPWSALQSALEARDDQDALELLGDAPRDSIPATALVLRDTDGRIWAKEYAPATDSNWLGFFTHRSGGEWWVLDPGGEVLAQVEVPAGLIVLDAYGDQLLGLTHDALGVERIVLHRIRASEGT